MIYLSIRDYYIEKNTEKINVEFNCQNYLSYKNFIKECNNKIKNKNITNIYAKIECIYIKEEI